MANLVMLLLSLAALPVLVLVVLAWFEATVQPNLLLFLVAIFFDDIH